MLDTPFACSRGCHYVSLYDYLSVFLWQDIALARHSLLQVPPVTEAMLIEINNLEVCIIGMPLTMAPTVRCSVLRLKGINIH